MLVDDEVADQADRMRWRWVAGQVINEGGMVNFGLYGRKRAKFVDGDPFNCTSSNLQGVGGDRSGRKRNRIGSSGVKDVRWDKSRNQWKTSKGRTFKNLDDAADFVRDEG
ncbi:hypothetical protein [Inquilinus limosus]|uniref:hypothetical protein n=1 Tax=Inquilinus limosus TaxID=171674 RepID=UPI001269F3E8|nr:hypothetical protein [Inquilinus limosus]